MGRPDGEGGADRAAAARLSDLRLSPDGTRLALFINDEEADIWVWDSARGGLTPLDSHPARDFYPVWTADGRRIVFGSNREGRRHLWWKAADGTGEVERLIERNTELTTPMDVSLDGAHVVFYEQPTGGTRDLMRLTLDGKREVLPLLQTPFEEQSSYVSPDGRWLAYQSDSSGRFEIYVRPFPDTAGGQWLVSTTGGRQPLWARSGKELFFEAPDGVLMRVEVNASGATWSASPPTKFLDVARYLPSGQGRPYDITPDGQRFVMIKPGATAQEEAAPPSLIVVQNWLEELKRRVPVK